MTKNEKKQTLFKKLYNNWKNIIKSWMLENAERRAIIKIEGSVTEAKNDVYDIIEKQKEMLCNITDFNHVEFANLMKKLESNMKNLEYLGTLWMKLFWVNINTDVEWDVWSFIEEAQTQQNQKDDNKDKNEGK